MQCTLNEHIFDMNQCDEVESDFEEANPILDKADELYRRLCSRDISVKQAIDDPIFTALEKRIRDKTNEIKQSRTAKLWLLFREMVAILKRFVVSKRTGIGSFIFHIAGNFAILCNLCICIYLKCRT
uniref:Uncharacterized protein n=1 Tax=Magallana gigas TaxID=29159 RepID=K1QPQ3_MAGGI